MNDEIRTNAGRVVGRWTGASATDLMQELGRIRKLLAEEKSSEKIVPREMPHRERLPQDLIAFNAYPIWGCDKEGLCVVGAGANRIEPAAKVRAFSLVEHH